MERILVLCGGQSPEHPISIRSCKNILSAIDRERYAVSIVGITKEGEWRLLDDSDLVAEITSQGSLVEIRPGRRDCFWSHGESLGYFDAVFPVLHGPNGEDGTIQGLLELLQIPYVGTGVVSSSVTMDKDFTKRLLRDAGINVARWKSIFQYDPIPSYDMIAEELGSILFVKPSNMGSSVGVHRVSNNTEWIAAVEDAFLYDQKVLVEESISGRELECAVIGNGNPEASGLGEVRSGDFYSFDEKYDASSEAKVIIPADLGAVEVRDLRDVALSTYKALGCRGLSRVDMFLNDDGKVYVNEVNTMPGFTSISMYPKLWEEEGLSYTALIDRLIQLAKEEM